MKPDQTRQRLQQLALLPDKWSTSTSLRPSAVALDRALEIVDYWAQTSADLVGVAPLEEGGFQFEWSNQGRELYVSCDQIGDLEFLEIGPLASEDEYNGTIKDLPGALARVAGEV